MLRSLYSGISGMKAEQQMLDVTGNNIANSSTIGFKASSVTFEDTLSQTISNGAASTVSSGGTSQAQIGLGVHVAAITTNMTTGSAQQTGVTTNAMIDGDGMFTVRYGTETLYTRAGDFSFDSSGKLVNANGQLVQGWTAAADGSVDTTAAIGDLSVPSGVLSPASKTTTGTFSGNLDASATTGTTLQRDVDVYDAAGNSTSLALTFTKTATGWDVNDGTSTIGSLTYTNGAISGTSTLTSGGVSLDFSGTTGYASTSTAKLASQDGHAAGTLSSYELDSDGAIVGTFSNGQTRKLGQVALAQFNNTQGLKKNGDSTYSSTVASGSASYTTPGSDGTGSLLSGYLESSNVDLSTEFSNLIIAQRGFQANARVITTSDSILQEINNLKQS